MKKRFKDRTDKLLSYFDDKLTRVLLALAMGKIVEQAVAILFPTRPFRFAGWVFTAALISLAYMYEDQLSVDNAKEAADKAKEKVEETADSSKSPES